MKGLTSYQERSATKRKKCRPIDSLTTGERRQKTSIDLHLLDIHGHRNELQKYLREQRNDVHNHSEDPDHFPSADAVADVSAE